MSFYIVEFVEGNEVTIISHAWYLGNNMAAWPSLKPSKFKHFLRNHILPASNEYKPLEIKILKKTDDYQKARKYEKRAEHELLIASTDAIDSDIPAYRKRRRVAKRLSDCYEFNLDVIDSPSKGVELNNPFNYDDICSSTILTEREANRDIENKENMPTTSKKMTTESPSNKEMYSLLQNVLSKVVNIETIVRNINSSVQSAPPTLKRADSVCDAFPSGYAFPFPIKNRAQFAQLNNDMGEEARMLSVVDTLSLVHRGISAQQCVRRICAYAFDKEFASEINWTGANGKVGLSNTHLSTALIKAVRSVRLKITSSSLFPLHIWAYARCGHCKAKY